MRPEMYQQKGASAKIAEEFQDANEMQQKLKIMMVSTGFSVDPPCT